MFVMKLSGEKNMSYEDLKSVAIAGLLFGVAMFVIGVVAGAVLF